MGPMLRFCFVFVFNTYLFLAGIRVAQQPQEQRYPFLPVSVVFSCVLTMVWLPVFGIFNVHTDVDACDYTQGAVRTP